MLSSLFKCLRIICVKLLRNKRAVLSITTPLFLWILSIVGRGMGVNCMQLVLDHWIHCKCPCKFKCCQPGRCRRVLCLTLQKEIRCKVGKFKDQRLPILEQNGGVPNGFPNIGNTCYMNVILQCMLWTPNFRALLADLCDPERDCSLTALFLFHALIAPKDMERQEDLLAVVNLTEEIFPLYSQHDSFELFNTLLSSLDVENRDENLYIQGGTPTPYDLFNGWLVTTYRYSDCPHMNLSFQSFTSLSIPVLEHIPHGDEPSSEGRSLLSDTHLGRGLQNLTKKETSTDFRCNSSCVHSKDFYCLKQTKILMAPAVLVMHFSRFQTIGQKLQKIQGKVSFEEVLNLEPYCHNNASKICFQGEAPKCQYGLFAVLCHTGSLNSGHYFVYLNANREKSFTKNGLRFLRHFSPIDKYEEVRGKLGESLEEESNPHPEDRRQAQPGNNAQNINRCPKWYRVSDSEVTNCSATEVFESESAYILFYERSE